MTLCGSDVSGVHGEQAIGVVIVHDCIGQWGMGAPTPGGVTDGGCAKNLEMRICDWRQPELTYLWQDILHCFTCWS